MAVTAISTTPSRSWSANGPDRRDTASAALYDGVKIVGSRTDDKVDANNAPLGERLPTDLGDVIFGSRGNDKLSGLGGDDWISGGKHRDILIGGGGNDCFVFDKRVTKKNRDEIKDFDVGYDKIVLDSRVFKTLKMGELSNKKFRTGEKAKQKNDKIMYDKQEGKLYYDHNGKKGKDGEVFAILDKKLDLDADSFFVI